MKLVQTWTWTDDVKISYDVLRFSTQHIVFGICKLIDIIVPDVPESLDVKIKRERYLAKQALADVDVNSLMV